MNPEAIILALLAVIGVLLALSKAMLGHKNTQVQQQKIEKQAVIADLKRLESQHAAGQMSDEELDDAVAERLRQYHAAVRPPPKPGKK